jgi:hypothetical protein
VIQDLLTGQYGHPIRVVAINTAERWSEDVSEDVAREFAVAAIYRCASFPLRFLISSKGTRTSISVS